MEYPSTLSVSQMQQRLIVLERLHQELIEDFIEMLQEIPGYETAVINNHGDAFTLADLIDDIQKLRPRGVECIRLWRRTIGTLSQIRNKRELG